MATEKTAKHKILVVDDDPYLLKVASQLLAAAGYQVLQAATAADGLRLARQHTPDLILLDVVLPDGNGIDLCRQIKAGPPTPAGMVVLISALNTASDQQALGLESGADGYIARPISNREFVARIQAMMRLKQAEDRLRQSEERFREMAENIREVFWLLDWPEQRVIYASPAYEQIWGRPVQTLYNRFEEWVESLHPDDRAAAQASLARIAETGGGEPREYRIIRPNGEVRWISDRGVAIYNPAGQVCRIAGIAEDITGRKQVEEELAHYRARLEELVQARTSELARANKQLRHEIAEREQMEQKINTLLALRESQVETSTRVAQEIAAAPVLDELFRQVVNLVQEQFGYYHAHIYTLEGDNLVMQAGTGQAGRRMKSQNHRIALNAAKSLVARAAREGRAVLVPDVSQAPDWLPNALLPETKAEIAVPIKLRDTVVGVLDIQNDTVDSLSEADHLLLLGLCGQIASAIEGTRRLEEAGMFRRFAEAAGQGFGMAGLEGDIIYGNPALWDMLGQSAKNLADCRPPEVKRRISREVIPAALAEGRWAGELAILPENGEQIHTLENFFLIRDRNGRPLYLADVITNITPIKQAEEELAQYRDHLEELVRERTVELIEANEKLQQEITERIQAEAALRQAEQRYRELFDDAPAMYVITRNQSGQPVITDCNRQFLNRLNYNRDEVVGQPLAKFYTPQSQAELLEGGGYRRALTGRFEAEERQLVARDGRVIDTLLRAKPETTPDGRLFGTRAMFIDISERKQMEQALQQSEEKFRNIVESIPMGMHMYHLEPDGRLIFTGANPAADNILGMNHRQFVGKTLEEAFPNLANTDLPARYRAIAAGAPPWYTDQIIYEDGQISGAFEVHAFQTSPSNMVATFLDITERKQVEEALRNSEARFRHVVTSISDHIYVTEITPDGRRKNIYLSPHAETLTGYPHEKFTADWSFWPLQVIHPDDQAAAAAQFARLSQGRSSELEYRLVRADGTVIWVRDSARVERQGASTIIYGLVSDIAARKQAEEAVLRYAERLEVLREIERGILAAQSPEAIVQAAVDRLGQLIPYRRANVALFDFAANEVILLVDTTGQVKQGMRVPFSAFGPLVSVKQTLLEGHIATFDKIQVEKEFTGILDTGSIQSLVVVPLLAQQELIGSLNLVDIQANPPGDEDLDTARQIADQLAIAIRQTRLYEQIRQDAEKLEQRVADRTRELSALYEVTAVASEVIDLPLMLAKSLEQVLAAMQSQVGAIHLLAPNEARMQLAAQQGITPENKPKFNALLLDNGLLNWVVEYGKPVMIPDLAVDTRLPDRIVLPGLHTYGGVPIRSAGKLLGVLSIFGRAKQQFNVEEMALLASIADQIGVAVENTRLRQQAEQAAVMEERARLARELHDSVTQSLYSLTLFAEGGLELAKNGDREQIVHTLERIGQTAQQALKEMRMLVYELRPVDLEQEGLVAALHRRLSAVEKRANLDARLIVETWVDLPAAVEEALYRIAQEALNNTLKHASATTVVVYLRVAGNRVILEVVDNGVGFDVAAKEHEGGLGLTSIRERVAELNGSLAITSTAGEGTRVKVELPLPE